MDCRTPSDVKLLNPYPLHPADTQDYHEELSLSLQSGRQNAAHAIQAAQKHYKAQYDSKVTPTKYVIGNWVLVKFPTEESGRMHKLSRPWHGPYRITSVRGPDVDVAKVYHPQDGGIQVHQSRVKHCPPNFPAGFYWVRRQAERPGTATKVGGSITGRRLRQMATAKVQQGKMDAQGASGTDDPEEESPTTEHIPISTESKTTLQHYQLCQNPRRNRKYKT